MSVAERLEAAGEAISPAVRVALLALEDENRELKTKLQELEARLQQNSTNSSRPPSSDPPGLLRRKKKPSGKKRGGQPGHPGTYRTRLPPERVDTVVEHRAAVCRHCGTDLSRAEVVGRPRVHQVVELPQVRAQVSEHRAPTLACPACGKRTRALLPAEVTGSHFGPHLVALGALLLARYHLSRRSLCAFFQDVLDVPAPALGTTEAFCREAAVATLASYRAVRRRVRRSAAAGVDETGWKLRGHTRWVWAAVTRTATLFHLGPSRSRRELERLLGKGYTGVVTSDRWSAYGGRAKRQLCWAHLSRNLEGLALRGDRAAAVARWGTAECRRLFGLWHACERGEIPRDELRRRLVPLQARFGRLLRWGAEVDTGKAAAFCRDLEQSWPHLWTFARDAAVSPTNNAAERALRKPVLWRKNSFGSASGQGLRFAERLLTLVETCRQQAQNPLDYLTRAIVAHRQNAPAPRLLPTR